MTSETDIANLALSATGARLVSSMETENTEEARICRLHFPSARDALLRDHGWNFATRRAALSRLSAPPGDGWDTAWQMPADCVRHLRITTASPDVALQDFALEGRQIFTRGLDAVSLVYVSRAVPVGEWDSLFIEALVCLLASRIAGPLSRNAGMAADFLARFQRLALPAARTVDAREVQSGENHGTRQRKANSPLHRSRFSF